MAFTLSSICLPRPSFAMFSSTAVALFASAALVAGHGIVTEVMVDGTWYTGTKVSSTIELLLPTLTPSLELGFSR